MQKTTRIIGSKLARGLKKDELKKVSGGHCLGPGDTNVNQDWQEN